MAFNKVALLVIVVCGTLATAYAGDAGEMGGNRKMLTSYYKPPKSEVHTGSHATCGYGYYYYGGKCVAKTFGFAKEGFAVGGHIASSEVGPNSAHAAGVGVGKGDHVKVESHGYTDADVYGSSAYSGTKVCVGEHC